MAVKLPRIIQKYVAASNGHDVKAVLACFSDNALVHDEGKTLQGKKAIEDWIEKTIEKYKFQFKPLKAEDDDEEIVVAVEVSGTFDGSPVVLDYCFTLENDTISSLAIE